MHPCAENDGKDRRIFELIVTPAEGCSDPQGSATDIEFCGAFAEVLGKTGHVRDILPLCAGCEIAQLHIVDHALA